MPGLELKLPRDIAAFISVAPAADAAGDERPGECVFGALSFFVEEIEGCSAPVLTVRL
jgi:hypothetical protein